jgi:hypothetical protein
LVIADDLNAVSPGIAEVEERPLDRPNAGSLEGGAHRVLVVDHQAEMATIVGRLFTPLLKGYELVAQIDKGHLSLFPRNSNAKRRPWNANASSMSPTSSAMWFKPTARGFADWAINESSGAS